jgi:hypothetical protein
MMSNEATKPQSKQALVEAFEQVLKTQAEAREAELRAAAARRPARFRVRPATWVALCILLFTGAYLWVEQPEWVFPPPPLPESTAIKEASLRISLANAAQHIERYRQKHGRLPATLQDTGTLTGGITYEVGGSSTYQLQGVNGPVRLSLRSTDPLSTFLGNSFEIIARRPR